LLQWTADYLKSHGAESPRLDAEVLLADAMGCQRIALYTSFDEEPEESARTKFREYVKKRAEGMPVAYLVGEREFYSMPFRVTPDVLIPRPETELLVVTALDLIRADFQDRDPSVCDIGTGSGNIAVTIARHAPRARVTAVDLSPAALEVARSNAERHELADRITFCQSDLFSAVDPDASFELIVSNPPYIGTVERESLPSEVKDQEPESALFAGPKGTEVIERLLPEAAARLVPGGHLLIEISPIIHDAALELLDAVPDLERLDTINDLARHPRILHGKKI
jgi:release factor glutamine methyltransferase